MADGRLETTGGFDTLLRYPGDRRGQWDLSAIRTIRFRCKAANEHAFQNASPWVRSGHHKKGYFEWHPTSDLLNEARDKWIELVVPIEGDDVWKRTTVGTPSLEEIHYFELHADTWDYGFTLWLDDVRLQ
ncbi:MAG: hypothetical protein HY816_09915 [Candidatus Wallbacteria bacterium]|nr:hypothetical protein [Candidatus Wallbacteria bacterium]